MFGDSNTLDGSSGGDGAIGWINGNGNLSTSIHDGVQGHFYATANSSYRDGKWHHLVSVLDTGGLYLYVDGVLVATNTSVNSTICQIYPSNPYLWIGTRTKNSSSTIDDIQYYNGLIDEVRISNIARTRKKSKLVLSADPTVSTLLQLSTSVPLVSIGTIGILFPGPNQVSPLAMVKHHIQPMV
jgi:hypothetical protein